MTTLFPAPESGTPAPAVPHGPRPRPPRGATLIFRMALFNMAALALLGAAFGQGWAGRVFAADVTGLTYVIAAVFAVGLGLAFAAGWRLSREIACAAEDRGCARGWAGGYLAAAGRAGTDRTSLAAALKIRISARLAPVRHIAASLVMLGLIGTVLGFILALSGISASMATSVSAVSGMITQLITGMSVALYTTLEGAVLSLWLTVNHQMLAGAAAELVSFLLITGERDGRA